MSEPFPLDPALFPHEDREVEDLVAGGMWLLDLISAVDFLGRGDRHGLTVWDALEEAIRWWVAEHLSLIEGVPEPDLAELEWSDPDPLRRALRHLLAVATADEAVIVDVALQQAVRRWAQTMAGRYNDDQPWPHPLERRTFPPLRLPAPNL